MDLSKLPAFERRTNRGSEERWYIRFDGGVAVFTPMRANFKMPDDDDVARTQMAADFCLLARQAFDVMLRRGWHARPAHGGGWVVCNAERNQVINAWGSVVGPDPFTALVEADRWYAANVESPSPATIPPEVSAARREGYDGLPCPACGGLRTVVSGDEWACDGCKVRGRATGGRLAPS